MTPQQIFDTIAEHLKHQNVRAYDVVAGACMYRDPDGRMCAVGCLISDEAYDSELEDKKAHHPAILAALSKSGIDTDKDVIEMLSQWQLIHDSSHSWDVMRTKAQDYFINSDYDLVVLN